MRYFRKNLLAIAFSALFLTVGCSRVSPPGENGVSFPDDSFFSSEDGSDDSVPDAVPYESDLQSQPFPLPQPPVEEPSDAPSDIWDVSDADISYIDANRKLISFTFDDAPGKTLDNLLSVFAAYNEKNPDCKATATVFCNGYRLDNHFRPLLLTALALGWELGNHSYAHPDLTALTPLQSEWEIDKTDEILQPFDKKARHLFRAPFGRINDAIRMQAHAPIINWTIDTLDWTGCSENEIYERVWTEKFSGGIVLMHDGYAHTVYALKRLLPDLKAAGYQVVSVSAMSKAHNRALRVGGEYVRIRKNGIGK